MTLRVDLLDINKLLAVVRLDDSERSGQVRRDEKRNKVKLAMLSFATLLWELFKAIIYGV